METTQAPQPSIAEETPEQRDVRLNKDVAAFSYVWIMSIVVLASRRDSPFIQYHAKQATILFLLSIPVAILPFVGRYLVFIVLSGMLLGFIHAANGRREGVPIVCDLATGAKTPHDIWLAARPYAMRIAAAVQHIFAKPKPQQQPTTNTSTEPLDNTPSKT